MGCMGWEAEVAPPDSGHVAPCGEPHKEVHLSLVLVSHSTLTCGSKSALSSRHTPGNGFDWPAKPCEGNGRVALSLNEYKSYEYDYYHIYMIDIHVMKIEIYLMKI